MATGTLRLAGAPIGDPDDVSPRLREALAGAEVIAAEDTRRLRRLTASLAADTTARVVSYFAGNEVRRTPELVALLLAGTDVLLITDAGMPSVSDPGYRLVAAALARDVPVTCLPGPSAVTTALAVSGRPADRFCFEGFLPRRRGARRTALTALASEARTVVFFEAPHRLADSLADAAELLGADRAAAVCRELTKTHEEVRRGPLGELAAWASAGVRGEVTVVLAGAPARPDVDPARLAGGVDRLVAGGVSRRDAIAIVAADTGAPRRTVYAAATKGR
ncbi:MAG: 16S rRNA (cytidine(1402)-2'-O)-methyltransferase [Mycobacteriales bacterium]